MAKMTKTATFAGGVEGSYLGTLQKGVDVEHIVKETWTNVAAASATNVHNAVTNTTAATAVSAAASDGYVTFTHPRSVQASFNTGAETPTLTVTGITAWGEPVTDAITMNGSTTVYGNVAFWKISTVTLSAASSNTLRVGQYDKLGFKHVVGSDKAVLFQSHNSNGSIANQIIRSKSTSTGALSSGTEGTCTGAVPANSIVLGVRGYVKTAITSGGTITDIDVGIKTADVDRFADGIALTAGTKFNPSDGSPDAAYTETIPYYNAAAADITVTANGGGSYATGEVVVEVLYIDLSNDMASSSDAYSSPGTIVAGSSSANADDRGTFLPDIAPDGTRDYEVYYVTSTVSSLSA